MRHERRTRGDARDADTVTLRIGNRNPITFGAPALELFVTVTVRYAERAGRLVPRDIGWAGAHEGFPAVELYVDGERLYHYDPRLVGASASELVGDPDHPFEGAMVVDELGACASIHSCLRAGGSFGVGDVYEGVAQRCLLDRGAPEAFETCVRGGGGFACFERFTGCDAPDGASLDQKACVVARGGSSCFAR
ncbi:MAG: hypothetical protein H6724_19090 [Sandaracinus sp.]|nr:hypothetical protein [Sandaracinus sp.]